MIAYGSDDSYVRRYTSTTPTSANDATDGTVTYLQSDLYLIQDTYHDYSLDEFEEFIVVIPTLSSTPYIRKIYDSPTKVIRLRYFSGFV